MTKLKLLTTTVILTGAMTLSIAAHAETEQTWFQSMTNSVQAWFEPTPQPSAEVEAYLDEVTIAVPPMTGQQAADIQPAAGDYQESLDEALDGEQSFNTKFSTDANGSVAAFEDTTTADDMANIMPAAGDVVEMNNDAIVVVEEIPTNSTSTEIDITTETSANADPDVDGDGAIQATATKAVVTETNTSTNVITGTESEMEEALGEFATETQDSAGMVAVEIENSDEIILLEPAVNTSTTVIESTTTVE